VAVGAVGIILEEGSKWCFLDPRPLKLHFWGLSSKGGTKKRGRICGSLEVVRFRSELVKLSKVFNS
jgi:hypothetical protein